MDETLQHISEQRRLRTLQGYGALDTPNEPEFDAIVSRASTALAAPIVLISLIEKHRQWFKAKIGLGVAETPRCISFCTHALSGDAVLVVPDATLDDRFRANPLVTGAPNIRFYAGAPLAAPNGYRIGTICIIDRVPRSGLSEWQKSLLTNFAVQTMQAFERRKARLLTA